MLFAHTFLLDRTFLYFLLIIFDVIFTFLMSESNKILDLLYRLKWIHNHFSLRMTFFYLDFFLKKKKLILWHFFPSWETNLNFQFTQNSIVFVFTSKIIIINPLNILMLSDGIFSSSSVAFQTIVWYQTFLWPNFSETMTLSTVI